MRPAVFLDRDGTLNVEVNYLHRSADLVLIDGVGPAIARLNAAGYVVVVVTNQAGIARGFYDERAVAALHQHIALLLAADGARIDRFYHCPHHPEFSGVCGCRKPAPGMLLQAADDLGLDLAQSWLVGDTQGDLAAGQQVGCRTILVRTGYGQQTAAALIAQNPDAIVDHLPAAVEFILAARRLR